MKAHESLTRHDPTLTLDLELPLPVSAWRPDETLYSLCARFHYVSGHALSSLTAKQLFGHPKHGTQHDFASRINVFVQRTRGQFGATVWEIVKAHTILPYYLPWRPPAQIDRIIGQLSAGIAGTIKADLGLMASRTRANHPLKACRRCMQNDEEQLGVSYWHLHHQLPGVWLCPIHDCGLQHSNLKATGVGRFLWYLPSEGDLLAPSLNIDNSRTRICLRRLAQAAIASFDLGGNSQNIDPERLLITYRQALAKRELLRGCTQIALAEVADQYYKFARALELIDADIPIPRNVDEALHQVSRALSRRACTAGHPLSHLLIVLWLFDDWDAFWESYTCIGSRQVEHPRRHATFSKTRTEQSKQELLALIEENGYTVSGAARKVGVAVQTAQVWASAHGIKIVTRPKLNSRTRHAVLRDVRLGKDPSKVATSHGISRQTILRMLRTDPGLSERWHRSHNAAQLLASRKLWLRTVKQHPKAILKELRTMQPACYAWLYRHDREWLTECVKALPKYEYQSTARVDWAKRDAELLQRLSETLRRLEINTGHQRVTAQLIYRHAPWLKPHLNKLDRLPLTQRMLNQIRQRITNQDEKFQ